MEALPNSAGDFQIAQASTGSSRQTLIGNRANAKKLDPLPQEARPTPKKQVRFADEAKPIAFVSSSQVLTSATTNSEKAKATGTAFHSMLKHQAKGPLGKAFEKFNSDNLDEARKIVRSMPNAVDCFRNQGLSENAWNLIIDNSLKLAQESKSPKIEEFTQGITTFYQAGALSGSHSAHHSSGRKEGVLQKAQEVFRGVECDHDSISSVLQLLDSLDPKKQDEILKQIAHARSEMTTSAQVYQVLKACKEVGQNDFQLIEQLLDGLDISLEDKLAVFSFAAHVAQDDKTKELLKERLLNAIYFKSELGKGQDTIREDIYDILIEGAAFKKFGF